MSSKPVRTFIAIVMNVLVIVAIALTVRMVVVFFGQLSALGWGATVKALTAPLIVPFGVAAIKTPYGGSFDVNAALTVVVVLGIEWVLSGIRSRA